MTADELKALLEAHRKWIHGEAGGERANLEGANLGGANLGWAYLEGANLGVANLEGANLEGAHLEGANLEGANLGRANLEWANLGVANLEGANLEGAHLEGANLGRANLEGAKGLAFQIPQEGELIVYKKLQGGTVAKLLIPTDAKRTASLIGRKCRAEFVKVLEGSGVSMHDRKTRYEPGEIVRPDSFNDDIRIECANGIHFFLTREEAEEYGS